LSEILDLIKLPMAKKNFEKPLLDDALSDDDDLERDPAQYNTDNGVATIGDTGKGFLSKFFFWRNQENSQLPPGVESPEQLLGTDLATFVA